MELMAIGIGIGAFLGSAIVLLFRERADEPQITEWSDLLSEHEGHIAQLQERIEQPRAVTTLTNRTKTVRL